MAVKPVPEGMERAIPHLVIDGAARAIEFYKEAFGAVEIARSPSPDGTRLFHAHIKIGDSPIFLCDDFPEFSNGKQSNPMALGGCSATVHQYVEDCDPIFERAEKAGAKVIMKPQETFWGDRYGMLIDPFGHRWSFATRLKEVSPEEAAEAASKMFGNKQA